MRVVLIGSIAATTRLTNKRFGGLNGSGYRVNRTMGGGRTAVMTAADTLCTTPRYLPPTCFTKRIRNEYF